MAEVRYEKSREHPKVLLIGGHLETIDKLTVAKYVTNDFTVVACQRAVLHDASTIADYVCLYDTASWKLLDFDSTEHAWIRDKVLVCKIGYLMHNLKYLGNYDDVTVRMFHQYDDQRYGRGCGPYALSFAARALGAREVVLHGFSNRGDRHYVRQLEYFPTVAERIPSRCKVYETPGSHMDVFPPHKLEE